VTRVVVLGAGPAGLAAALELAEAGVDVTLLERRDVVGGHAGSFDVAGVRVDYGSHRLHPASDPAVLARIRALLGDDLLERPRHGRIRLLGRWIHFPLRPLDLLMRVHPRFALGAGLDLARKPFRRRHRAPEQESFASVLEDGLGPTICREFYFPYARKIWGLDPTALSAVQARKRVSAGSLGKMVRRLLPGGAGPGAASSRGIFYYPRHGYGQIAEALLRAARNAGARVHLGARVHGVALRNGGARVRFETGGEERELEADQVYSTIPLTLLAGMIEPGAPEAVRAAAGALEFRSMLLVYLVLERDRFSEYDAHYFPEADFPFSRVSEPKNYAARGEPRGRTVLCAEIPCDRDDAIWSQSEQALGRRVAEGLERAGLPPGAPVSAVQVVRIPFVYPLYRTGYERHFQVVDGWLSGLEGVLTFGRQGLYAHDNTHHAMYMARAAARCLRPDGRIDAEAWRAERAVFETHVVED
jgi:protoporphyrinogen oxidase